MSLKSIEMQIALPRTQEAGKVQNQFNERGIIENAHLNTMIQKKDEQKRKTVTENEQMYRTKWKNEQGGQTESVFEI